MRYFGTFILLAFLSLGFSGVAQAEIDTDTKTKTSQNQIKPVTWGDVLEQSTEETKKEVVISDVREQSLARWKLKQSHLWNALPEGEFIINASAYTAAADECGKSDGITASGVKVAENRTLACPPAYPFGAKIAIEGYGVYTCEDRGGAIKGNHFDIYVETKKQAFAFGRRNLLAEVVQ
jgi:3D (Asp-Asp-Asp) domain-containing protein